MAAENTIVIPDTHGHVKEVEKLIGKLDKLGYLPDRKLVFLGDYVDRGPAVRQLIDFCIGLQNDGHVMLAGNHEYTLLRAMQDGPDRVKWVSRWGRNYEDSTLASYGIPYRSGQSWEDRADELRQIMPQDHLRFLESLDWMYENDDLIAVHAGLDPLDDVEVQRQQLLSRAHPNERGPSQLLSHEFARTRAYNLGKVVVSGHASRFEPYVGPDRVMLDCGVDSGGPLVAWVADTGEIIAR